MDFPQTTIDLQCPHVVPGESQVMAWRIKKVASTGSGPLLAAVLVVVGLLWILLFVVRIHAHQPNVDDYLYANVARGLTRSVDPLSAVLHTGQTSPLVLVLAMPGVALFGVYGAISVELPLLLLLSFGAFVLARHWLSPLGSAITALGVGLNAAVLGYAVMLNFAVAATTAVLWCFATYVRSDHLSNLRWSIGFGLTFAALILSRSVAPVYAAPLLVVVAVDVAIAARRRRASPGWPALAALVTVLLIAGPWWVVSGRQVLHYLTYAGYQSASGYTNGGVTLTPASVVDRVKYELSNLGWSESVVLGILVVATLFQVLRDQRARRIDQMWIPALWLVGTLLVLASSGNGGTAFGLPLIAATIVVCAVVLGRTVQVGRRPLLVAVVVLLFLGAATQFTTSINPWWPGPPYRIQAFMGGGTQRTNIDALISEVANSLGSGLTISTMNAPFVNNNGLAWYARDGTEIYDPSGPDSTQMVVSRLASTHALITGNSLISFNPFLDQYAVERAAFKDGLRPARFWKVSDSVNVVVWKRGTKPLPEAAQPPSVRILLPRKGAELSRPTFFVAEARDVIGILRVSFEIRGASLSHPITVPAFPFAYGWLGGVNMNKFARGTYAITCVAQSVDGSRTTSQPTKVQR